MKCNNTSDVVEFELGEDFMRSSEAEDFARPMIQSVLDGAKFVMGDEIEIQVFCAGLMARCVASERSLQAQ